MRLQKRLEVKSIETACDQHLKRRPVRGRALLVILSASLNCTVEGTYETVVTLSCGQASITILTFRSGILKNSYPRPRPRAAAHSGRFSDYLLPVWL